MKSFTLAAWWAAFTDELQEYPRAGVFWEASRAFTAYIGTDLETFTVGTSLRFAWGSVETLYGFPGFSLSFGLSFGFYGYELGARHGTGGSLPAWNGFWALKSLKK